MSDSKNVVRRRTDGRKVGVFGSTENQARTLRKISSGGDAFVPRRAHRRRHDRASSPPVFPLHHSRRVGAHFFVLSDTERFDIQRVEKSQSLSSSSSSSRRPRTRTPDDLSASSEADAKASVVSSSSPRLLRRLHRLRAVVDTRRSSRKKHRELLALMTKDDDDDELFLASFAYATTTTTTTATTPPPRYIGVAAFFLFFVCVFFLSRISHERRRQLFSLFFLNGIQTEKCLGFYIFRVAFAGRFVSSRRTLHT